MSTINTCTICKTDMYRVEKGGANGYTAYDQHTGEEVPMPPEVLKNYSKGPQRMPLSWACPVGFPTSYRCVIQPNGGRGSRIGEQHIKNYGTP